MRVYHAPYEYVEYPKWVRLPDGRDVIVQSKDEEDALLLKPRIVSKKHKD